MKFEKIDGVHYIVLDKNEKICITTPGEVNDSCITVKENNDGLDIIGETSIVNSISGNGMLEKLKIPPVVSKEEIVEKCDKWIEMFKKVHNSFKELVLTDEYKTQHLCMTLNFGHFFSIKDEDIRGKTIDLDIRQYGTIVKEGLTLSIDDDNKDIYNYIVANIMNYYISENMDDKKIDLIELNGTIYSKYVRERGATVPMYAAISSLTEDSQLCKILSCIIANHNLKEPCTQLIDNLRDKINNQQIGDRMDSDIDYSSKQCQYILKKSLNNNS